MYLKTLCYKIFLFYLCFICNVGYTQLKSDIPNPEASPAFLQIIDKLDLKNTDLKDVARLLATKYAINVFVADDVQKRITVHLVNVKLADALNFIVTENNLALQRTGDIYKIVNPPAPEAPPKVWELTYKDDLLSLNFQNEDLQEAVQQIAKVSGKTILLDRFTSGNLSGALNEIPFEEGLTQLLKTNGYLLVKKQSTYQIRRSSHALQGTAPANSPGFWLNMHEGKIELEASGVPLRQVLEEISRQSGFSIVFLSALAGTVDARIKDVDLEECLSLVLMDSDYTFKKRNDIYLIGDKKNKGLTSSQMIKLKHIKVDGILELLPEKLVDKAELKIVKAHNGLLVNGAQDVIADILDVIQDIDHPIPQIFLEALVVDFNTFDTKDFSVEAGIGIPDSGIADSYIPGIDLHRTGKDINQYFADIRINDQIQKLGGIFSGVNIGRLPEDFYLRIKALETKGKANIRSKPQIATLNGHTAELKIGETRYFKLVSEVPLRDPNQVLLQTTERFQTVDINISLKITPWVSSTGEITVEINPEFNTAGEQISPEVPPNIQSRTLNSTVRLRDGETIVLGGLIQEIDSESISRVPILGRIPLLGRLFSSRNHNKTKSELIIYVTPHLTYGNERRIRNEEEK